MITPSLTLNLNKNCTLKIQTFDILMAARPKANKNLINSKFMVILNCL